MRKQQIKPYSLLEPLSSDPIILGYSECLDLLIASFESKINIFDFRTQSVVYSFCTPQQIRFRFKTIGLETNETYFFALTKDGESLFVKNLSSNQELLLKLNLPPSTTISSFASIGSTLILGLLNGSIYFYDFKNGKIFDKLPNFSNSKISLLKVFAGFIAVGYDDGAIVVLDEVSRKCLINFKPHTSSIINIHYCPLRSCFYSSSSDNSIIAFSLDSRIKESFGFKSPVRAFISLNQTLFAFDDSGDIYSFASNTFCLFKRLNIAIQDVFACNDQVIVLAGGLLLIFNSEFNAQGKCLPLNHSNLVDSCLVPFGEHKFLLVSSGDSELYCYSVVKNNINYLSKQLSLHRDSVISILQEDANLITASRDGEIIIWQIPDFCKKLSIAINQSNGMLTSLASCSLGNEYFIISAAFENGMLILYKISKISYKYEEIWSIKCHKKEINSLTFINPNTLATTSQDKLINIIDIGKGSITGILAGHKRGVLSFDSNSKYFVSGSSDKNIILWDKNFNRICNFGGHDFPITKLKFLRNGTLLSGDSSGLVKLWDASLKPKIIGYCDYLLGKIWALQEFEDEVYISDSNGFIVRFPVDFSVSPLTSNLVNSVEEDKLKLFLGQNRLEDALKLSFLNKKPLQAYNTLQKIIKDLGWNKSRDLIISFLKNDTLPSETIDSIVEYSCDWCTHNKRTQISHLLINSLLSSGLPINSKLFASLRPYMERHYNRIDEILRHSYSFELLVNK